ncbi:MAG: ABC transporter ATP-binding protein, partial [Lachnospiraceae bacterium]|nr:ABC transporter ATP-binding protein [Lachnospiraceae bacterium]
MVISEISKSYKSANGLQSVVLDKFSLNVNEGDFISVMGPSGSGKTTLLKILCGLEKADTGQIIFENKNLCELGKDDFAELRRDKIGIVFQDFCLINNLTVKENILLPRMLLDNVAEEDAEGNLNGLTDFLGIGDILGEEIVYLSGGQKQRAAICRALVNSPKLILADEPTGNLDAQNTIAVMKYLEEINAQNNTTIIMV